MMSEDAYAAGLVDSAARASAAGAELQIVVPLCGAGQPVVRGFEPPQRNRSLRVFSNARDTPSGPRFQSRFVFRGPATAGLACGEAFLARALQETPA